MTISVLANVKSGQLTIPVGNTLLEGKQVHVTIVDSQRLVPMLDSDLSVEVDEMVNVPAPARSSPIQHPVIRIIKAEPCLIGLED